MHLRCHISMKKFNKSQFSNFNQLYIQILTSIMIMDHYPLTFVAESESSVSPPKSWWHGFNSCHYPSTNCALFPPPPAETEMKRFSLDNGSPSILLFKNTWNQCLSSCCSSNNKKEPLRICISILKTDSGNHHSIFEPKSKILAVWKENHLLIASTTEVTFQ